jgi:hypothetical protein
MEKREVSLAPSILVQQPEVDTRLMKKEEIITNN